MSAESEFHLLVFSIDLPCPCRSSADRLCGFSGETVSVSLFLLCGLRPLAPLGVALQAQLLRCDEHLMRHMVQMTYVCLAAAAFSEFRHKEK